MRKSFMYILDVFPDKKEATLVFSDRLLYNLVPYEQEIQNAILSFLEDYTIYEIDDKYFRDAVKPEPNSNSW